MSGFDIYAFVILCIAIVYIVYLSNEVSDLKRQNNYLSRNLQYYSTASSRADQYGPLNPSSRRPGLRLIKGGSVT